jgi:hypothetical protein
MRWFCSIILRSEDWFTQSFTVISNLTHHYKWSATLDCLRLLFLHGPTLCKRQVLGTHCWGHSSWSTKQTTLHIVSSLWLCRAYLHCPLCTLIVWMLGTEMYIWRETAQHQSIWIWNLETVTGLSDRLHKSMQWWARLVSYQACSHYYWNCNIKSWISLLFLHH